MLSSLKNGRRVETQLVENEAYLILLSFRGWWNCRISPFRPGLPDLIDVQTEMYELPPKVSSALSLSLSHVPSVFPASSLTHYQPFFFRTAKNHLHQIRPNILPPFLLRFRLRQQQRSLRLLPSSSHDHNNDEHRNRNWNWNRERNGGGDEETNKRRVRGGEAEVG